MSAFRKGAIFLLVVAVSLAISPHLSPANQVVNQIAHLAKFTGTGAYFSDSKKVELKFQAVGARSDYIHACRCRNKVCIKNIADFNIEVVVSNCGISNYVLYPGEKLCVYKNTTVELTFEDGSRIVV